jgi:hypothetical protein
MPPLARWPICKTAIEERMLPLAQLIACSTSSNDANRQAALTRNSRQAAFAGPVICGCDGDDMAPISI